MTKEKLEKLKLAAQGELSDTVMEDWLICHRATPKLIEMIEKLAEAIDICSLEYELIDLKDTAFTRVQAALKEVYE